MTNKERYFWRLLNRDHLLKKKKKTAVLICCILVLFFAKSIELKDFLLLQSGAEYLVTKVVDGDTIIMSDQREEKKVRLIGIDTPESVHPNQNKNAAYGKIDSAFTKEKLEGKKVKIEYDVQQQDSYGRSLAYVYVDGVMFNKTLLKEGHAAVATYPPNVKYVQDFLALQKQAQRDLENLKAAGLSGKAKLLKDIVLQNPYQNPPAYEKLKYDLKGAYSRRINIKHRFVYSVEETPIKVKEKRYQGSVVIIRMWTHYE